MGRQGRASDEIAPASLWTPPPAATIRDLIPLGPATPTDRTRSDPERDFLALCRRFQLSGHEVKVRVGRWIVDFLWRAQRPVVEVDSWLTHGGSVAFEDDHQRDLDLRAAGPRTNRYTATQVETEPDRVAADLRRALAPA